MLYRNYTYSLRREIESVYENYDQEVLFFSREVELSSNVYVITHIEICVVWYFPNTNEMQEQFITN